MKHRPLCSTPKCGRRAAYRTMVTTVVYFMCHSCRLAAVRKWPKLPVTELAAG